MKIIKQLKKEFKNNVDKKYKEGAERYFKEDVKPYGVRTFKVKSISSKYFKNIKTLDLYEILKICEKLLQTGYFEDSYVAFDWSYRLRKKFKKSDFKIFEKWMNTYVSNWAECDNLGSHIIGYFIETFPDVVPKIKKWTKSNNRWVRRGSAVSFVILGSKGLYLKDIFEIATTLMYDEDDLVQKGYGWMLKATSKAHQKKVFNFVVKHRKTMPRKALRYAIEKMPPKLRKEAMKK